MKLPKPDNKLLNLVPTESTEKELPKYPNWIEGKDSSKPANTADNLAALTDYMGIKLAFNELTFRIDVLNNSGIPLNHSFERIRSDLISNGSMSLLPKAAIEDHFTKLAEDNKFHPIATMLNSHKWDGVSRVDDVISCLNPVDKELASSVMRAWLIGCVAALYEPNFMSKLVPVLQGEQSFMKTAYISRIANIMPNTFLEGAELNPDNKDSVISCISSWIVELGELERTSKNAQGSLKAFLTKSVDTVRLPYSRSHIDKKRQTLFIGSVNGHNFLKDETGSSRYGVIEMKKPADIDRLNSLLGWQWNNGRLNHNEPSLLLQFWLEVKALYENGGAWHLTSEEVARTSKANLAFDDKGNWYQAIEERILSADRGEKWCSSADVCTLLGADNRYVKEIGKALTRLAKEGRIEMKEGRSRSKSYFVPHWDQPIGYTTV